MIRVKSPPRRLKCLCTVVIILGMCVVYLSSKGDHVEERSYNRVQADINIISDVSVVVIGDKQPDNNVIQSIGDLHVATSKTVPKIYGIPKLQMLTAQPHYTTMNNTGLPTSQTKTKAAMTKPDKPRVYKGILLSGKDKDKQNKPARVKSLDTAKYWNMVASVCQDEERRVRGQGVKFCPCVPKDLVGDIRVYQHKLSNLPWSEVLLSVTNTTSGGRWRPAECAPRRRVLIIIPYRDREHQLRAFLAHTHGILQRQMLDYTILVVEQRYPFPFNKGALMNAGFLEAAARFPDFDCVVFHDVDMLMGNDKNMFFCYPHPLHMGAYIDKFGYNLTYTVILGGVVAITPAAYRRVNGFSNRFYGWGGEDDNFSARVRSHGYYIMRGPQNLLRYTMMRHRRDFGNKGVDGSKGFRYIPGSTLHDGLSKTKYRVVATKTNALFTWIQIDVLEPLNVLQNANLKTIGNYNQLSGQCLNVAGNHSQITMSLPTCQWMCDTTPSCAAVQYHSDVTSMGDHCYLLSKVCDRPENVTGVQVYVSKKNDTTGGLDKCRHSRCHNRN